MTRVAKGLRDIELLLRTVEVTGIGVAERGLNCRLHAVVVGSDIGMNDLAESLRTGSQTFIDRLGSRLLGLDRVHQVPQVARHWRYRGNRLSKWGGAGFVDLSRRLLFNSFGVLVLYDLSPGSAARRRSFGVRSASFPRIAGYDAVTHGPGSGGLLQHDGKFRAMAASAPDAASRFLKPVHILDQHRFVPLLVIKELVHKRAR